MKYLGVWMSYDKQEIIKSIKSKLKGGSDKKIAWLSKHLSGKQQLQFKNWLMRSLLLFHTASSILTQEITVTDLSNIIDFIERKIKWVPAWVSTATANASVLGKSKLSWIVRISTKMLMKLWNNKHIQRKMRIYKWKEDYTSMYTDWAFKNDIHEDRRQSIEISKSKSFIFMLQVKKNVFYEYDNDKDYHYL